MSENIQVYRALSKFLPNPGKKGIVLLTGARQTGKTTLAKSSYGSLRYINLDSPENRDALRAIRSQIWGKEIGRAVLDEAQKEPSIFEKLKYAYDDGAITFSVILGSSQILLLKKIRESLAGRVSIYEMFPLMMSELARASSAEGEDPLIDGLLNGKPVSSAFRKIPSVLIDKKDAAVHQAEEYLLKWGGMPALLYLTDEERWKWLKDYEYTYLERDLVDLARLDDLGPFRKFQKLSALRSAQLLNYSEIARDVAVSVDTARRYLEYLRISYQTYLLQPYHKNLTSSVVKTPKLYWLDLGLLRQLGGFHGEFHGNLYETMVVSELVKWVKTTGRECELYFYRTRSGLEVDLIVETKAGVIGIEIKGRKSVASRDFYALREIAARLKKNWLGGMVVYQGDKVEKADGPELWAVPSRRLFA